MYGTHPATAIERERERPLVASKGKGGLHVWRSALLKFWTLFRKMASAMKSLSRLIASGGPGKKQKTETTLEEVAIEDGFELKQFTFEEGAIGFVMSGTLEHTSFGIDVALVKVTEVVPDSQAAKFGVAVGSIVKMIGKSDVTQVKTMEDVLKMLRATPRPVEITMTVPLPNEELDGERARLLVNDMLEMASQSAMPSSELPTPVPEAGMPIPDRSAKEGLGGSRALERAQRAGLVERKARLMARANALTDDSCENDDPVEKQPGHASCENAEIIDQCWSATEAFVEQDTFFERPLGEKNAVPRTDPAMSARAKSPSAKSPSGLRLERSPQHTGEPSPQFDSPPLPPPSPMRAIVEASRNWEY